MPARSPLASRRARKIDKVKSSTSVKCRCSIKARSAQRLKNFGAISINCLRWFQRKSTEVFPFINWPDKGRWLSANRRSEEHTSELQSLRQLVCRLLLDKNIKISV